MFSVVSVCPQGGVHPLGRHPPDGHSSGPYASYWNAFLCRFIFKLGFPELPWGYLDLFGGSSPVVLLSTNSLTFKVKIHVHKNAFQ